MSDLITNERIRAPVVRLVESEQQSRVLSLREAITYARKQDLDLVLVADGSPPVCRILDADKFRFQNKKAEREQAKRQRAMTIDTKEIQLRPVTDDNDISIKAKRARGFLDEGDKVRVTVRFRGRERSHKDWGVHMIERFLAEVGEHKVDRALSNNDSDMTIVLASMVSKADLVKRKSTVL